MTATNSTNSVMLSLNQFVDALNTEHQFTRIEVIIDTKLFPNTFGINVRPIHITLWTSNRKTLMNMQDIIDKFSGICYIRINESTHRRLSREPSMIVINTEPKTYNEHVYYDYRIGKLFLLDELKRYQTIYDKAHEVMKKFKEDKKQCVVDMQGTELIE